MNGKLSGTIRVGSTTILALTVAGASWLPMQGQAPNLQTTEQVYKNIQVLKGVPSEQLMAAMEFIRASLGVECDYCHEQGAYEKDDKKSKQTARKMMRMVFSINNDSFDGERRVTCYSCHRGVVRPVGTPMIPEHAPTPATGEASAASDAGPGLPGVDQLLDKYVSALGGNEALRKISSRVERGMVISAGRQFRMEVFTKAPDKRISIMHLPNGDSVTAYDGWTGWTAAPNRPFHEMRGSELEAARFEAEFFPATRLRQTFNDLRVERLTDVRQRKAHVVAGLQAGQPMVRVYFDAESGLLVRLVRFEESPLGRSPTQTDFLDYRSVDGVKTAFRKIVTRPRGGFTIQMDQIQHNVPVEDAKFARPYPEQAEPR